MKASASFLKKRSKKLLFMRAWGVMRPTPPGAKVFLLLFLQKKQCFLQ
jgi:hypothetical protein